MPLQPGLGKDKTSAEIAYLYKPTKFQQMPLISTEEKLNERIKELSCLYNISNSFLNNRSVPETLDEICSILRSAYRVPEKLYVRLELDDISITTDIFPSDTVSQTAPLLIFQERRGSLTVAYDAKMHSEDDFLIEEQRLLNKVASEISIFYQQHLREQKITLLKRSAERADRLAILGEITAGIAHELNTPLGNILGFAELIAARSDDQQMQQDVSKVIKAAIYSREIVKKLMFFSCEMPQHMQHIKIHPVVEQALTLLEPNFRKAGLSYQLLIDDHQIEAQLDPIQLTQVLFNIIVNAIYVSPAGSSITTKIYSEQDQLFIEIADEGPGIDPDNRQKIFEPFFTTKPFGEGNGLGLSVVHGIIKSHQGKISTFANKPRGTVFKIELPLKHQ